MIARLTADAVVLLHLGFIVFVALGGLLALRWPKLAWAHIPAVIWGAVVEFAGWICPLTPLENRLRDIAGNPAYTGDFIERYIVPIVYPVELTRGTQLALGTAVIVVNFAIYGVMIARRRRRYPHVG